MSPAFRQSCACVSDDPYSCWSRRYDLGSFDCLPCHEDVDIDGGPCECGCHDDRRYDEDD
jgi:hypothetical protein